MCSTKRHAVYKAELGPEKGRLRGVSLYIEMVCHIPGVNCFPNYLCSRIYRTYRFVE